MCQRTFKSGLLGTLKSGLLTNLLFFRSMNGFTFNHTYYGETTSAHTTFY